MLIIKNTCTDAYFNLAAEEYLLKRKAEDVFMAWRNDRAVIIGRNQDAAREVDDRYAAANGIKVVRRLTGGGAVYHDAGNVNYTFIQRKASEHFGDFPYFAAPVIAFLKRLGVDAEFKGKNDIVVKLNSEATAKIAGTAQVMFSGDILFHGTLLIDADMGVLAKVLKPDYEKLERHAIKSISSRVANLKDLFNKPYTALEIIDLLIAEFLKQPGAAEYGFTKEDNEGIIKLTKEKYSTRRWNYEGIDELGMRN